MINGSTDKKNSSTGQASQRWFIDLDWHQRNKRSFAALAKGYLCPKCREQLSGEVSAAELLANIKDCCAKTPGFINGQLPVLDSIFRLFLANGNQPLGVEELGKQLTELRGGDTYRTSPEILRRLLNSDRFYGLQPVRD